VCERRKIEIHKVDRKEVRERELEKVREKIRDIDNESMREREREA